MTAGLEARPFGRGFTAEVAQFIADASDGGMPADRAAFVIGELIAGPEAVLDLWRGGHRVAVAVSIDNCATVGNAAELSLFGGAEAGADTVRTAVEWGQTRAAAAGRSYVDLAPWPGTALPEILVAELGFAPGYWMFHMARGAGAGRPRATRGPLALEFGWHSTAPIDLGAAYYDTAAAAFATVPGSFVSPSDDFLRRLATSTASHGLLVGPDDDARCAGFVRVERRANGVGDVAALGRHPRYRGRGLGEHLLGRGLTTLLDLGCAEQSLEVAAVNTAGLALYESFGFVTTHEACVMRRPVPPATNPPVS